MQAGQPIHIAADFAASFRRALARLAGGRLAGGRLARGHQPSTRSRGPCATFAMIVACVTAASCGLLAMAVPAQAAGNPALDKQIISNPESGWPTLSSSELNGFANDIESELESKATGNETFTTAVQGWQSPSGSDTAVLAIFLIQISNSTGSISPSSVDSNFCTGATNTTPASTPSISGVPDSAIATCSGTSGSASVGTAVKGNIVTLVASAGSSPLSASDVDGVVADQINSLGGSSSSGSGGSSLGLILGVVIGVVVVAAAVAFFLLQSRRRRSGLAIAGGGHIAPVGPGAPFGGGSQFPASPVAHTPAGAAGPGTAYVPPSSSDDPWGGSADPGWVSSMEAAGSSAPPPAAPAQSPAAESLSTQIPSTQIPSTQPPPAPITPIAPVMQSAPPAASAGDAAAATPTSPGWYPEDGDPHTMRYWDGATFTARRRWNGSAWLDA